MFRNIPKVSYSLLASLNKGMELKESLTRISKIGIDLIHYDVSEETNTLSLEELDTLRLYTDLPFDVHLAVRNPEIDAKNAHMRPEDYFCIHVENQISLDGLHNMRRSLGCHFGVAINMETSLESLDYAIPAIDFVLFMAAKAGVSGGSFEEGVVEKIRLFKRIYPDIKIHIDGGINHSTALLVRDVGVDTIVSGSFILKDDNYSNQVAKLVGQNLNLPVTAIMRAGDELPWVYNDHSISDVANEIDKKKIGCTCVIEHNDKFIGLITDTDIRRFLIKDGNLSNKTATDLMNRTPFTISPQSNIIKLMRDLEKQGLLFSVIPVVDNNKCLGVLRLQDILFSNVLGQRIRHV
jgi:ribulose-phosphate 3-epimerase